MNAHQLRCHMRQSGCASDKRENAPRPSAMITRMWNVQATRGDNRDTVNGSEHTVTRSINTFTLCRVRGESTKLSAVRIAYAINNDRVRGAE